MEERVSLVNKCGEKLIGLRAVPSDLKEKNPCMILAHGFGVTKEEYGLFDGLAEKLSRNGVIVYRFDFSGCGESERNYTETSLTKNKEELESIFEFVKKDKNVGKIGLLGQSRGAAAVIISALDVECIVLTGAGHTSKEKFAKSFGAEYNPEGISNKKKSDGRVISIGPVFWKEWDKYNIMEEVKKVKCPILFVHGSKDVNVPVSEMELVYENAINGKKIIIEGADHGLLPYREKAYGVIVPWIVEVLK
ncbi:MAG: alpha/beta hydrolase [Nanoarchaeota archaeon]|nr:alpha/beta hydrolase [Nanoarchaeota archaeon]